MIDSARPEDGEGRVQNGLAVVRPSSPPPDETASPPDNDEDSSGEALDPDEILFPDPFDQPSDFAPIPPPEARLRDLIELIGHITFVILLTVVAPLTLIWAAYRLYRWLPFETMALVIVSMGALWSYRDRFGPLLRRVIFGREQR
ncbi:MAG: hypothetical protein LC114_03795 [Bryobacterales bacterium]|nr:hypothetical protein [Bryobacterales bacterium]